MNNFLKGVRGKLFGYKGEELSRFLSSYKIEQPKLLIPVDK